MKQLPEGERKVPTKAGEFIPPDRYRSLEFRFEGSGFRVQGLGFRVRRSVAEGCLGFELQV